VSLRTTRERELRQIAIAANSGEATDEQLARLDRFVQEDPYLANYAARLFDQQASLAWQGSLRDLPASSCETLPQISHSSNDSSVAATTQSRNRRSTLWSLPTIAVGIAFLLGMLAASIIRNSGLQQPAATTAVAITSKTSDEPAYEARLIRSTACLWDGNSAKSREIGSGLTSGESLHLLEGLAEFNLNWSAGGNAMLALEGPAAMMLSSEGMPTLRFGRLTATISASFRPFVMETPVGRLVLADYGSIGVSAFGNEGEIHVFDGSVTLEPAWSASTSKENLPLRIEAGQAIRVQENPGGELTITRHPADEDYFVAQRSMTSDGLFIPPAYVDAVKKSAPLSYWRFERDTWPIVPNVMGPKFEARVEGSLGAVAYQGNQAVDFGVTDQQGGEIICNDLIVDEIESNYSFEFWFKPSHYHVGAVISLIGDPETPNGVVPHGMLLEMGGTDRIPTAVHHPGRIRFLHRNPPSNDSDLGTSCYSNDAYTLRKWQHVVASKDGSMMHLYINGQLVGEAENVTSFPSGMRLLVGRLYPSRGVRPFIGQLDELALYGRALSPKEIQEHYRLVRTIVSDNKRI